MPVGTDGKIKLFNGSAGATDLVADVSGFFTTTTDLDLTSAYMPMDPYRFVDTRNAPASPLATQGEMTFSAYDSSLFGNLGVNIYGFVMNATVTNPKSNGYLTFFPALNPSQWETPPNTSALNWAPNETVPNLVIATPGTGGWINVFNGGTGSVDVVLDAEGYFQAM